MRLFIAEQFLRLAFYVASPKQGKGEAVRFAVCNYFKRFRESTPGTKQTPIYFIGRWRWWLHKNGVFVASPPE